MLGIWDAIKEIIEKIKQALGDLPNKIKEIIKNLQEKINEIIKDLNLEEIIEKIKEKIMEVIGQASEKVKACIDAEMPEIQKLAEESKAASEECVNTAREQIMAIKYRVQALINQAEGVKDQFVQRGTDCVKNHILHPNEIIECLKTTLMEMQGPLEELKQAAIDLIQNAKNDVEKATIELANCMNDVSQNVAIQQERIIDEIEKCVAA